MNRLRSAEHRALMETAVEARKATQLNQRDFAVRLGRDYNFVWKLEVGERRTQVIELIEIGWGAGIRPDSLIDRIVLGRPLVVAREERIRVPLTARVRDFMEETLIAETVTARMAAEKSQRQVGEEIGRSESYIWKLEKRKIGLQVIEYLALSKAERFRAAVLVAKVARATIAKVARSA